ncbi:quinone-dependent dihydroorotate dehydrogenase [Robiginitalea sp. SC105]|uniref:quinone-dependent dihydroorotate dehydrogenase n=1 Tax=Robiginitalea sp. SC105 TaxID=2762332 RepID=UPI00163B3206|nr:quinone-dependent dihydroorotate dehydrogenase [Robiginitalea sp. SC105]MBC2839929.1 quinone-dependent dihydroorotate dehydrogenase [Robiginitalea sp. SC105]
MYKYLLRPVLFLFDPERVHHLSFSAIRLMHRLGFGMIFRWLYCVRDPRLEREVFGLKFPNPVGLAAGFDKDALLFNELSNFGFGFVEIGTLTPKAQAGNPPKRLFRLRADQAIINRMGFNNRGVFQAAERLAGPKRVLIGGNIGKNKATPNQEAVKDYMICFEALFPHVDYFVVNVSSPNTPGLRELQEKKPLTELLRVMRRENSKCAQINGCAEKPLLLKIAPDLTDAQLRDIIDIVRETGIDGVIATNTTISREGLKSDMYMQEETGGLSGRPLRKRATEVIRFLVREGRGEFPVIGVGGIHSAEDALEKLEAGASLVQIWTGFVYEGPALVRRINKRLLEKA